MTKLKKQVVRLKISHLLNNNKYILFYPRLSNFRSGLRASRIAKPNAQTEIDFWNPDHLSDIGFSNNSFLIKSSSSRQSLERSVDLSNSNHSNPNHPNSNHFFSTTPLTIHTDDKSVLEITDSDDIQAPHFIWSKIIWDTYKSFLKGEKVSKLDTMISPILRGRKIVPSDTYLQNINNQSISRRGSLRSTREPTTLTSNSQNICAATTLQENDYRCASTVVELQDGKDLPHDTTFEVKDDKQLGPIKTCTQKVSKWNITILFLTNKIARKAISSEENCFTPAFQGNIFLLGCQKLSTFQEILKKYNRPIGGIYNTCTLDHFQIQRLADLKNDKQSYQEFLGYIKMPRIKLLFSVQDRFSFSSLLFQQIQLLQILQFKNKKLSF